MVEKTAAFRQRRAADTARWRERLHRGAAVYPVEVDGTTRGLGFSLGHARPAQQETADRSGRQTGRRVVLCDRVRPAAARGAPPARRRPRWT